MAFTITKAGDPYLRSLLMMGARSALLSAKRKTDSVSRWAMQLEARRGYWRAVTVLAAKNTRMLCAALRLGESFVVPR